MPETFEQWFKRTFGALGVDPNSLPPTIRDAYNAVMRVRGATEGAEQGLVSGVGRVGTGVGRMGRDARGALTLPTPDFRPGIDAWGNIGQGALGLVRDFANPNSPFSQGIAASPAGRVAGMIGRAAEVIPQQLAATYLEPATPIGQQGIINAVRPRAPGARAPSRTSVPGLRPPRAVGPPGKPAPTKVGAKVSKSIKKPTTSRTPRPGGIYRRY